MFEKIPIVKRWKVIIGIIGFAFAVSLLYAKQVWDMDTQVETLRQKTKLVADADLEIVNRQVRLKQLSDEILGSQPQSNSLHIDSHGDLMHYIQHLTDTLALQLIQLPQQTIDQVESYQIAQINFSVSGNFQDIVTLIYQMEAIDHIGTIAKADLALKTLRKDSGHEELLMATIHLTRLVSQNQKSIQ